MSSKTRLVASLLVSAFMFTTALSAEKAVVDTSASPHTKFRTIGLDEARWAGGFWGDRWERNARVTVPTMKQVMELPDNSATFHNLRVAAGQVQGNFFGNNWSDGDCYKWIEAASRPTHPTHSRCG